jgi:hypothetical protein
LHEILINILKDPSLGVTYIVIDALDECIGDLSKLLRLIVEQSATTSYVKWIVSSRNWPQIEQQLDKAAHQTRLSLELNAESVANAVNIYIRHKVAQLAHHKGYNLTAYNAVLNHLLGNAEDTFLWVALVCKHLEKVSRWNVIKKLSEFPPGLNPLYKRMLEQICQSYDTNLCRNLLVAMVVAYRPITMAELTSLSDILIELLDDNQAITDLVSLCGSFLTIQDSTIYFVHQSAKEFLSSDTAQQILPFELEDTHQAIWIRSLYMLTSALQRDIYGLQAPGYPIEQVRRPDPDPLAALRYACVYWLDHVCDWLSRTKPHKDLDCLNYIYSFLREKYLYWLEALSICGSMSEGVLSIAKLYSLIQVIITLYTTKRLAYTMLIKLGEARR